MKSTLNRPIQSVPPRVRAKPSETITDSEQSRISESSTSPLPNTIAFSTQPQSSSASNDGVEAVTSTNDTPYRIHLKYFIDNIDGTNTIDETIEINSNNINTQEPITTSTSNQPLNSQLVQIHQSETPLSSTNSSPIHFTNCHSSTIIAKESNATKTLDHDLKLYQSSRIMRKYLTRPSKQRNLLIKKIGLISNNFLFNTRLNHKLFDKNQHLLATVYNILKTIEIYVSPLKELTMELSNGSNGSGTAITGASSSSSNITTNTTNPTIKKTNEQISDTAAGSKRGQRGGHRPVTDTTKQLLLPESKDEINERDMCMF